MDPNLIKTELIWFEYQAERCAIAQEKDTYHNNQPVCWVLLHQFSVSLAVKGKIDALWMSPTPMQTCFPILLQV